MITPEVGQTWLLEDVEPYDPVDLPWVYLIVGVNLDEGYADAVRLVASLRDVDGTTTTVRLLDMEEQPGDVLRWRRLA